MNNIKVLNNTSKEDLLSRLAGFSSSNNKALYEFALMLHEETKDIDWVDSGGKMNFLNELVKRPDIYVNDAGALRQVIVAGRLIAQEYRNELDYVSRMGYWNFVAIARARLSNDDEENIRKKKELVKSVIEGFSASSKIIIHIVILFHGEIRRIKKDQVYTFNIPFILKRILFNNKISTWI